MTQALAGLGKQARYNQLREQIMQLTDCSKRTAQLAIAEACQQGWHRAGRRPIPLAMVGLREDRGLAVSLAALRCQLAAMPCRRYEVRLIHSGSRKPYPGVRQWTGSQLSDPATVGFLRIRNREGYDVYFRPYAGDQNAGYILLDLDDPVPGILARLRAQGHEPCVVVATSPGRWQAWIRVSPEAASSRTRHACRQTVGADVCGRSRQRRLAAPRKTGRIHQPKTRTAPS